jgi:hypothetical protein
MRTSYFARRFVPGCDAFALSTQCEKSQLLGLLFSPGFELQLDLHPGGGLHDFLNVSHLFRNFEVVSFSTVIYIYIYI